MAWLTRENPRSYSRSPKDPDMETLSYWLARIEPLIRAETDDEIIVVFANRTGIEEEAVYAGTSAVLGIQGGEVKVYGILGRGEKELLVVDTDKRPQAKLVSEPNSTASEPKRETVSNKSNHGVETRPTATSPSGSQDHSMTMEDVVTPLSPVDPISPHAYFAPKGRAAEDKPRHENLKSSTTQIEFSGVPNSHIPKRPESPKSRNASRTRQAEQEKPPLISHDLADDQNVIQKTIDMRLPPYSAPMAPDRRKLLVNAGISSGDACGPPRPKSAVW
jgi:protein N-terminal amidase